MTRGNRRFSVLAALTLFALSLAQNWSMPAEQMPLWNEALRAAANLAADGTLSSPFAGGPTGPTAHIGPGYPYLASLVISAFGTDARGYFVLQLLTNLVVAVHVALLPWAASQLGLGFSTGLLAGLFYIAAEVPTFPAWEASYAGLLGMWLTVLVYRFVVQGYSARLAWPVGILWGILLLTSPTLTILFAVWFAYQLVEVKRPTHLHPRAALAAACLPILMVLPWTVRNYAVFGSLIPIRDNFGLELEVSNNPCSGFNMGQNLDSGCFGLHHPNNSAEQAARVRRLGEVAYNADKLRAAIAWIQSHPGRFLALTGERFVHFWFPTDQTDLRQIFQDRNGFRHYSLMVWLMTLLGTAGLCLLIRGDNKPLAFIFSLWLGLFPLVYYITQFDIRYRAPILWTTFLLASHAVVRAYQSYGRKPAPTSAIP
jgi:hypothetical protein